MKLVRNVGVVALVTIMTVLGISGYALTQTAAAAEAQAPVEHGGGRGLCGETGLQAAATALGLTTEDVTTQLRAGETLTTLAEAQGKDVQAVVDAVNAACLQAKRDSIEQAVTDGTMTREKADWLLEGLDKGYWGVPGAGGDFGFGGPHRPGFGGPDGLGGGRPPRDNTTPPTNTSTTTPDGDA
jgi:hypothetical protein